ncbi:phosphonoacetaldehyde hydrolase [Acidisoma cellulosilytica]|uniref:Phosphonoacetaldehyde hydrolase n=1 Tax=Acidisoma cellulosilyticum TaxID=2802395 RepID=A0A963Z692_9PROT|nr:phosphonoacetaldehyde hydrolase [Acidisoma cellulosilyticum]MCB8883393.1 phosphonoacetaldehyde hydrolase [Acidisoma cellulosilyticum]
MSHHLKAAIFDWAGTVIDFGSRAPMGAFVEAYKRFDVDVSVAEARKPMGLPKRAHIAALMADPDIAARWADAHGALPGEAEIDALYAVFVPLNTDVVADYCTLIPGAVAMAEAVRARGMKLGSTTGYVRPIMDRVLPLAAAQGYVPDNLVCAGDLADGRPTPLMMYRCFADLGVYPPSAVVKIDDTEPGILEGLAAGTWTVGVSISGNCVGLSHEEWLATPDEEQAALRAQAEDTLLAVGAHYVIDSIADLVPVLDEIEARMARGEHP